MNKGYVRVEKNKKSLVRPLIWKTAQCADCQVALKCNVLINLDIYL